MRVEVINDFFCNIADGAHGDNDAVSIGSAIVVKELVVGAELLVDLLHIGFNDCGQSIVVLVASLTVLEEDIAVFVRAAHCRSVRIQAMLTELVDSLHIAHFLEILVVPDSDFLDLMGGTEAVKEVDERNTTLDSSQMGNSAEIHNFLRVGFAEHSKTGLAASVDIGVVTEDVQSMGSKRTGRNVEHARKKLAGDFVHIRDHQEQTLRGGVGRCEGTGGQRAVYGTGSACLRLHFDDLDAVAEDVQTTLCGPLIDIVCHGAGRGDGIDAGYFGKGVADMRGGSIAVHGFEFSCQNKIPP